MPAAFKCFQITAMIFVIAGCASEGLRVYSTPDGAEVSVLSQNRPTIKVGKTPVEIDSKSVPELFTDSLQVQVSKEGYTPQSVLVPKLSAMGGTGRVSFNLEDTALPKACVDQQDAFNEVARGVAEASSLLQRKKLIEASTLLLSLTSKFSSVAVLYDLQGNVLYLQKDFNRALEAYKRSNVLTPNNPQTLRMINKIQEMLGAKTSGG